MYKLDLTHTKKSRGTQNKGRKRKQIIKTKKRKKNSVHGSHCCKNHVHRLSISVKLFRCGMVNCKCRKRKCIECDKCCICACTCMKGNLIKKRLRRCDDSYNPCHIVKSSELTCEQQCEESQSTDHVLLPNPGDPIKRLFRALQMDERSSHITHVMP